jgi:hypothetical protein
MLFPKTSSWTKGVHFEDVDKWCREWNQLHHMNATCKGFVKHLDHVWSCETCFWLDNYGLCCNPTFGRVWGWHSHSQNGDLGIPEDSRNFRVRLQGSKHLALCCSLYHWKALKESYKFTLDLVPIEGLSKELWPCEVPRVQTGTISGLHLGSPGTKRSFGCGCDRVTQRILYGGRWWLPPSPGCGESNE